MNRQQIFAAGGKWISLQDFIDKTVLVPKEPGDNRMSVRVGFDEQSLSEEDIERIVAIVGKHCPQSTKDALALKLGDLSSLWAVSRFLRLELYPNGHWEFSAGQDYTHEVRLLRADILK